MKIKAFNHYFIPIILVLLLVSCSPSLVTNSAIPPTSTIMPSPASTNTPTMILSSPTPTLVPETDFIKGIWLVDWGLGNGVSTLDGKIVMKDIIRPLGANWIAIAVPCHMNAKTPENIDCNVESAMSDADIKKTADNAHSLGLRIALFPFVLDVTGVTDNWSANLDYGADEVAWSKYFDAYELKIVHYAKLAEQNKIDLLIIGGEQTGAQKQEKRWRALISEIRVVYHGPITYEAWCQHFDTVKWWDALDYIGINFYCFPLSNSANPTYDDAKKHYIDFLKMIKSGTSSWNKQVIFTEIGYESIDGVAQIVPFGKLPVHLDVEEQAILVHSFTDAIRDFGNNDQWLKGLFWYNYTSNPLLGGVGDINFTPHNKPAENYLRAFYTNNPTPVEANLAINQIDEKEVSESHWFFDEHLENNTQITQWTGKDKQSIINDPLGKRGNVIALTDINYWEGLQFQFPVLNIRDYDYIELYLYSPLYEPNLQVRFDGLLGDFLSRWLYIRSYIDHEPLLDKHWHRIQIPINILFPSDRNDMPSQITTIYFLHFWPGQPNPITFYIDDIRLIKTNH